jgi:predicted dehydrogenase
LGSGEHGQGSRGARGRSHALGLLANPDRFELAAVCDLEQERALARALGVARIYTDPDAMLAAERPDTDPDVRHYHIRLLPWVTTPRRTRG